MPRRLTALGAATAALVLASSTALAAVFPDQIQLANNWQPEGIAAGRGTIVYVGSRLDGSVTRLNLLDPAGIRKDDFIKGTTPPAAGLEYEDGADRLWVAGGGTGEV